MPAPVMNDLERVNKATEMLARGDTCQSVADALGVSRPTISRTKAKHQDMIQAQAERYLEALPSLVDQDLKEMTAAAELSTVLVTMLKDKNSDLTSKAGAIQKFLDYTDKKVTDIKRSIGFYSAHTPAMIYQQMNIYNDNRSVISPTVLSALDTSSESLTSIPEGITIDVEGK